MMKHFFLCLMMLLSLHSFSQKKKKETMSEEEIKNLKVQISESNIAVKGAADKACKCIDSFSTANKSKEEITKKMGDCIDKSVMMYSLMKQTLAINMDTTKNNQIYLNDNKESNSYKKDYYELERYMMDSCKALNDKISVNDELNKHSISSNEKAMKLYTEGIEKMENQQYNEAIELYKKALAIDDKFAFCWDNLGICFRKLNKYTEALDAYNNSLKVDPEGVTPLQNIALVYIYKEEYNKAIFAYKNFINKHKNNPEGYYGLGRAYIMIDDYENALHNICKAYNIYSDMKSPYRSDAEDVMSLIFQKMKKNHNEKLFDKIMKENGINVSE